MRLGRVSGRLAGPILLILLAIAAFSGGAAQPVSAGEPATLSRDAVRDILRDARKIAQPRGVEELKAVEIGGIKQWISVRGRDRRNPILLFIHGGPAAPELPASWLYQSPWEDYFTVVQWDQRGAGKTAASNDEKAVTPTINVERMTADGEELVAYLRSHYGKRKIFVLGHSWGSVIGLNIARRHPDWLHAYIGMGQFIDGQENERVSYAFALRRARADGNGQAVKELEALAPYPKPNLPVEDTITQRKWVIHYGGLTWGRSDYDYEQNAGSLSPEYRDEDHAAGQYGFHTLVRLLPELSTLDFRTVRKLDTPLFLFAGRYDYETPSEVAVQWFGKVKAPHKRLFWFEHSAHVMHLEQPGKVLLHLVRDIRPIAERAGDSAPPDRPGTD